MGDDWNWTPPGDFDPFRPPERPDLPRSPRHWQRGEPIALHERRLGEIIDGALRLYALHWQSLVGIVAFLVVPLRFLEEYLTRNYHHERFFGAVTSNDQSGRLAVIGLVTFLISFLVVQPLLTGALVRAVTGFHLGEQPTAGDILDYGLPLIRSVLLVTVLYSLVVMAGVLLLVLGMIWFAVRFLFGPQALVVEGYRGRDALRRSWRLTKGSFWRILGIILVAGILAGIVTSALTIPANLGAIGLEEGGWWLRALGGSAAQVLAAPFAILVQVLLYLDLRVRKEGFTLAGLAQEVDRR